MTTAHRSLVAAVAGLVLLAACGSTGTSKVDSTTTQPATTVVEPAASPDTTAAAADTTAASTTTTGGATPAAPVTVDASVTQALTDADALLGANDQDMASASSAAANGG